jgi:ABC-type amino acid transport substrate-binding protein
MSILLVFVFTLLLSSYEVVASDNEKNINISTRQIELTKEEKNLLDELGELKIIVDDDYAPISFYAKETESFGGISVDILKILSDMIGFDYHIIRDESLSWSDRLDLIKNNKVHILCGASINDKRKEFGYFTDEYYFSTNFAMIGYVNNHINLKNIKNIKNWLPG